MNLVLTIVFLVGGLYGGFLFTCLKSFNDYALYQTKEDYNEWRILNEG